MAAPTTWHAGHAAGRSSYATALSSAASVNRRIAGDALRTAEELGRRVAQSQRMIEQALRTIEATRLRRLQLARIGL